MVLNVLVERENATWLLLACKRLEKGLRTVRQLLSMVTHRLHDAAGPSAMKMSLRAPPLIADLLSQEGSSS